MHLLRGRRTQFRIYFFRSHDRRWGQCLVGGGVDKGGIVEVLERNIARALELRA